MMDLSLALNAEYVDRQYLLWKADPARVSREWQIFFEGFELAGAAPPAVPAPADAKALELQSRVGALISRYRDIGHLLACLDPLVACPTSHPLLDIAAFGLSTDDLDRRFALPNFAGGREMSLREIVGALRETYCRSVGVEYMHLQDPGERRWLRERLEPHGNRPSPGHGDRLRLLRKLCQATLFEQYLHARYVGQKRFSIEGAETAVAMLDAFLLHAAASGVREVILGMSHRGRLNVQVNILEKPYEAVFCEFEDNYDPESLVGAGDVKYHSGVMADLAMGGGDPLKVLLVANPSHLEAVDPVVEGLARARQEQMEDRGRKLVAPVLLHGDAAFAGQGIVSETLNLSQLEGYRTGGTLHIVINNQIGFTTLPEDARSTRYSTDVAKMLMVPIFHVHGEDPEAAAHVVRLALDYRMAFGKDVVIDVVCYRRYGHNEGDEPYYTQPRMYDRIKDRPPVYRLYAGELIENGVIGQGEVEGIEQGIRQCLDMAAESSRGNTCSPPATRFFENWEGLRNRASDAPVETGVPEEALRVLARRAHAVPAGFNVHPRLGRILDRRLETVETGEGIDWATAEMLAFASLLTEGVPMRFSGQDSRRGTFSQRHSVLADVKTGEQYTPLNHLQAGQAPFKVFDSMLAEGAVLGFEYGYSVASPLELVIWEAQFGDFANNAQAIIDQFIAAGESKWERLSGLVLLLPHGFEGQGPEHSSARLERFLQLCAEDNIQVCNPTTPAQFFHLLRRQIKRSLRKPLVVMTPKSLLRHPMAVSRLSELAAGRFREVMDDPRGVRSPRRVVLCGGKVYYDLLERLAGGKPDDAVLVRLEQYYPFPGEGLLRVLEPYASCREWIWAQEEPENMGAWPFLAPRLKALLERDIVYAGRPAAASPATGHHRVHKEEQARLVGEALGYES